MEKSDNVLVTGGEGFIGRHLVNRLRSEGILVESYDLKNAKDILNLPQVCSFMRDRSAVIHLAAEKSVPRSWESPEEFFKTNIQGTFNVLMAAIQCQVPRVILASSSSAKEGLSPYAISKVTLEHLASMVYRVFNLQTLCLRFFNVFGPGQEVTSPYAAVIPRFISSIFNGHQPVIYGDGFQRRDFTYIDNVLDAILLSLRVEQITSEVLEIGGGESYSVIELLSEISEIAACPMPLPRFEPARPGEIRDSCADIQTALAVINYAPRVSFQEGLRRTVDWYRSRDP